MQTFLTNNSYRRHLVAIAGEGRAGRKGGRLQDSPSEKVPCIR